MIKIHIGLKGSGKTKKLIEAVNNAVNVENGNVVCITDGNRLIHDIDRKVRMINTEDFNIKNFDELAPFADFNMLSTEEKPLKTYHGRDWDTKCLDNIIYTDTLVLKKSKMVYSELSDHDALTAEFEMRQGNSAKFFD